MNPYLPPFAPPGRHGLLGDGQSLGGRQGDGAGLAALGGSELAEGDGGRVAGVRRVGWQWRLASGFLDDLPGQPIGVAWAFTCASRHGPLSHRGDRRERVRA